MELSKDYMDILLSYKTQPDDDNVRIKNIAKQVLVYDPLILYLLNNKELEENESAPEDYIGVNVLNNYQIHPTQTHVANFICICTDCVQDYSAHNNSIKVQRITFYVLCEEKTNFEKNTGSGRHDLISARIKTLFNRTNIFGNVCRVVSEREDVVDNDYAVRSIVFELTTDNNLSKTIANSSTLNYRKFYNAKKSID